MGIFNLHFAERETETQRDQNRLPGELQVSQVRSALPPQPSVRVPAVQEASTVSQ